MRMSAMRIVIHTLGLCYVFICLFRGGIVAVNVLLFSYMSYPFSNRF